MRIKRDDEGIEEGDLTPMIDMTFQLIAFFMVLVNFSQNDQDARVQLPQSTLAKPPEAPLEFPVTLHLMKTGDVVVGGQQVPLDGVTPHLLKEAAVLALKNKTPSDATVIIRADGNAPTGKVQELIKICQENRFDRFALRAKEGVGN